MNQQFHLSEIDLQYHQYLFQLKVPLYLYNKIHQQLNIQNYLIYLITKNKSLSLKNYFVSEMVSKIFKEYDVVYINKLKNGLNANFDVFKYPNCLRSKC